MKQFLLLAVWQLVEADWAFGTPLFYCHYYVYDLAPPSR